MSQWGWLGTEGESGEEADGDKAPVPTSAVRTGSKGAGEPWQSLEQERDVRIARKGDGSR